MPTPVSRHDRIEVPTRIYIPPDVFNISKTVTIKDRNGNTTDVSSRVLTISITGRSITEGIHSCSIELDNTDGFYINQQQTDFVFTGGETLTINADYGAGTTRIFKGKCNAPIAAFNGQHILSIEARTVPEIADRRVVININGNAVTAVKNLIDTYLSSVMTYSNFDTNLGSNTTTITVSYDTSILSIISDIFKRAGWDGSIEFDTNDDDKYDLLGHSKGSAHLDTVTVALSQNLVSLTNWGFDNNEERNTLRILGKEEGGAPILYTIKNQSHIDKYWRKDEKISDSTIISYSEIVPRATLEINEKIESTRSGTITSVGDPNVVAGNTINADCPQSFLGGKVLVKQYQHTITDVWTMTLDISKEMTRLYTLFANNIKLTEQLQEFDNPNEMEYSLNLDFDKTNDADNLIANKNNITITASKIQITTGTTATVESITRNIPNNVTSFDIVLKNPEQFEVSTVQVSNDSGATYTTVNINQQLTSFPFSTIGNKLKVKITLNADGGSNQFPSIDGLTVRVK